ncbi:hypothetical protein B0J14DRAFT_362401 [Halenospora varia]|nr:hypothetical protein B0J14DRAFT_362401 [Halenospora varia]
MDPISITISCVHLVASVTRISVQIHVFVREVRDARGDLDAVSRELYSLKSVLEILAEDAEKENGAGFPPNLSRQISGILTNCAGVLEQIQQSLEKYGGGGVKRGVQWTLGGRDDMMKLRSTLEAHKSALEIALDMVALSLAREIKSDTEEIRDIATATKDDTSQILAEIARLQSRLPPEGVGSGNGFALQRYLDNMSTYAESSAAMSDPESDGESSGDDEKRLDGITEEEPERTSRSDALESEDDEMHSHGEAGTILPSPKINTESKQLPPSKIASHTEFGKRANSPVPHDPQTSSPEQARRIAMASQIPNEPAQQETYGISIDYPQAPPKGAQEPKQSSLQELPSRDIVNAAESSQSQLQNQHNLPQNQPGSHSQKYPDVEARLPTVGDEEAAIFKKSIENLPYDVLRTRRLEANRKLKEFLDSLPLDKRPESTSQLDEMSRLTMRSSVLRETWKASKQATDDSVFKESIRGLSRDVLSSRYEDTRRKADRIIYVWQDHESIPLRRQEFLLKEAIQHRDTARLHASEDADFKASIESFSQEELESLYSSSQKRYQNLVPQEGTVKEDGKSSRLQRECNILEVAIGRQARKHEAKAAVIAKQTPWIVPTNEDHPRNSPKASMAVASYDTEHPSGEQPDKLEPNQQQPVEPPFEITVGRPSNPSHANNQLKVWVWLAPDHHDHIRSVQQIPMNVIADWFLPYKPLGKSKWLNEPGEFHSSKQYPKYEVSLGSLILAQNACRDLNRARISISGKIIQYGPMAVPAQTRGPRIIDTESPTYSEEKERPPPYSQLDQAMSASSVSSGTEAKAEAMAVGGPFFIRVMPLDYPAEPEIGIWIPDDLWEKMENPKEKFRGYIKFWLLPYGFRSIISFEPGGTDFPLLPPRDTIFHIYRIELKGSVYVSLAVRDFNEAEVSVTGQIVRLGPASRETLRRSEGCPAMNEGKLKASENSAVALSRTGAGQASKSLPSHFIIHAQGNPGLQLPKDAIYLFPPQEHLDKAVGLVQQWLESTQNHTAAPPSFSRKEYSTSPGCRGGYYFMVTFSSSKLAQSAIRDLNDAKVSVNGRIIRYGPASTLDDPEPCEETETKLQKPVELEVASGSKRDASSPISRPPHNIETLKCLFGSSMDEIHVHVHHALHDKVQDIIMQCLDCYTNSGNGFPSWKTMASNTSPTIVTVVMSSQILAQQLRDDLHDAQISAQGELIQYGPASTMSPEAKRAIQYRLAKAMPEVPDKPSQGLGADPAPKRGKMYRFKETLRFLS